MMSSSRVVVNAWSAGDPVSVGDEGAQTRCEQVFGEGQGLAEDIAIGTTAQRPDIEPQAARRLDEDEAAPAGAGAAPALETNAPCDAIDGERSHVHHASDRGRSLAVRGHGPNSPRLGARGGHPAEALPAAGRAPAALHLVTDHSRKAAREGCPEAQRFRAAARAAPAARSTSPRHGRAEREWQHEDEQEIRGQQYDHERCFGAAAAAALPMMKAVGSRPNIIDDEAVHQMASWGVADDAGHLAAKPLAWRLSRRER